MNGSAASGGQGIPSKVYDLRPGGDYCNILKQYTRRYLS